MHSGNGGEEGEDSPSSEMWGTSEVHSVCALVHLPAQTRAPPLVGDSPAALSLSRSRSVSSQTLQQTPSSRTAHFNLRMALRMSFPKRTSVGATPCLQSSMNTHSLSV